MPNRKKSGTFIDFLRLRLDIPTSRPKLVQLEGLVPSCALEHNDSVLRRISRHL
jgi:hypothetical protein